jgi:hypothetical protein
VSGSDLCLSLVGIMPATAFTQTKISPGCGASVSESGSGAWSASMSSPRITYAPRGDTSAKVEASILANIYALALQKHKDKDEATRPGSPEDGTKIKEDSANEDRST